MLWNDTDEEGSGESVLMWYYGTGECIKNKRGRGYNKSCVAAIKREVGGDVIDKPIESDTVGGWR